MSTSTKTPASVRRGGPGSSRQDATEMDPAETAAARKGGSDSGRKSRSRVSGGGGEQDAHHTHDPLEKGGR
jgi:hypothetical protein